MAKYPGASAQVLADSVAAPLEKSINGIENMIYMFSNSAMPDRVILNVYFEIGTNPDLALINTQNKVNLALMQLPEETRNQGIVVQKSSPCILLFIAILDPNQLYTPLFVANYTAINIVDELQRIHGVSSAQIANPRDYAMRICLKPYPLAQF
jgi:multidrug efflux pump subunit AcrB